LCIIANWATEKAVAQVKMTRVARGVGGYSPSPPPNCSYFHELKVLILISGFMVIKNFQECDFFTHPPKLSNQNKVFI
jgi:hypothetical protein